MYIVGRPQELEVGGGALLKADGGERKSEAEAGDITRNHGHAEGVCIKSAGI